MLSRITRRAVEGIVIAFAALGFFVVPLGERTGFQHARAILETRAARDAMDGMSRALGSVYRSVWSGVTAPAVDSKDPPDEAPLVLSATLDAPDASL